MEKPVQKNELGNLSKEIVESIEQHDKQKSEVLKEHVTNYLVAVTEVEKVEQILQDSLKRLKDVEDAIIAEGLAKFSLPTGEQVEVITKVSAKLADAQELIQNPEGPAELKEKLKYTLEFKTNSDDFLKEIVAFFDSRSLDYSLSFGIHHSSLNSFANNLYKKTLTVDGSEISALEAVNSVAGLEVTSKIKTVKLKNPDGKTFKRIFKKGG